MRAALTATIVLACAATNAGQPQTHVLQYTPPSNVFRAGIQPAEDYTFTNANGALQVYQFRPFTGNILQAFQTTLLRDWIAPMHLEENVGTRPTFVTIAVQGADRAVTATFADTRK